MQLVPFFNGSSSLWLPLLRDEIMRCNGNVIALVSPAATRCTTTLLYAISVLQCRAAFSSVLTSQAGRERLAAAEASTSCKFKTLKAVAATIRSGNFWNGLTRHLDALVPTIEASLIMKCGSATLADVLYSFGRQYQCFALGAEGVILRKLEKRFGMFEFPPLFLSLWLHSKYKTIAKNLLTRCVLSMVDAIGWLDSYVTRWCHSGRSKTSVAASVAEGLSGRDH
jgi:hypothetical protein